MFDCYAFYKADWLFEINNEQQLVRQDCFSAGIYSHLLTGTDGHYYIVELGDNGSTLWNLRIKQLDDESNVLWEKYFGTSYGLASTADNAFAVASSDGGVVAATEFQIADGDISQEFGEKDCWVVKIDDEGNMVWETTLGTESNDFVFGLQNANDGGRKPYPNPYTGSYYDSPNPISGRFHWTDIPIYLPIIGLFPSLFYL